ncbi:MAG: polyprenol phosphomannose-dependent alpha 1,6 mannosyltransferase MptB [Nocardioidaceae bacterium]|nr:polyprenol phosphomannose-dependent alpha 1,6 mannosyltransferase MptB [Nocardioidaceae bacterium]MCL2611739.1 polyprenol phosphomannose-dependent alpha 1,6 mannosyltransferase MptB [Nocardioidaceae bacterium]
MRSQAVAAVGAACTTAGAFLYSAMPTDGHVGRFGPLDAVRSLPHAEVWGLLLCFAGLSLLTGAWLRLGLGVRRGDVDIAALRRAGWVCLVPLLVAPPLFSGDGWSYAADALLAGHGSSPYVATPSALHGPIVQSVCVCWMHTTAPYGPLPLMWGGAFARITSSPWVLMLSYRLLAVAGFAMLLWAAPRLAALSRVRPVTATWLVTSPFVLVVGVGGTHLDLVMIGIVAVALALTPSRGWLVGAVLIGIAAAVKAPAAVAALGVVLLTLRSGSLTARVVHALRVAAVVVAVVATIGLVGGLGFGWIGALHSTLVLHTPLSLTFEAGRLTGSGVADTVGVGLLLVGLVVLLRRAPTGRPRAALLAVALAMLLTTVLSPVTNYWYYLWCVPLLAVAHLPARGRGALVAFVAAMGLIAPLDPALHIPGNGVIVIVVVLAALAIGAAAAEPADRDDSRRRLLAVPTIRAGGGDGVSDVA